MFGAETSESNDEALKRSETFSTRQENVCVD